MRFIRNTILTLVILIGIFSYAFLNLGKYLDSTTNPSESELIVCLGGGFHINRVKKSIELYQKGYLKGDYIIYTGVKSLSKNVYQDIKNNTNIIINDKVKNTMEEILYIKSFIKEHHLNSVTIITEIPHSRRVKIFWDNFGEDLKDIHFSVVQSELPNWNSEKYYENKFSREYAFSELTKLVYNFFVYGILENIG